MPTINLPDPTFRHMELVADPRAEKGANFAPQDIKSWVELSDPQHLVLHSEPIGDDKELEQFLAANDGRYRYDYVRLGCTFRPATGERFEKAWLSVTLRPDGQPPQEPPLAWSMFPSDEYSTSQETASTKIGSSAKILSAEFGASRQTSNKAPQLAYFPRKNAQPILGTLQQRIEHVRRTLAVPPGRALRGNIGDAR